MAQTVVRRIESIPEKKNYNVETETSKTRHRCVRNGTPENHLHMPFVALAMVQFLKITNLLLGQKKMHIDL